MTATALPPTAPPLPLPMPTLGDNLAHGAAPNWLPETTTPLRPCALASLARLDLVDLRFETQDRTPEDLIALADRVDAAIGDLLPPIGIDNVLIGLEKLATRYRLALPDADLLEADVRAMADWPAERWMAAFERVWAGFRSGWSRFPTLGDFCAALDSAPPSDRARRIDDLRRLSSRLRQEAGFRRQAQAHRRRLRERENALYRLPPPPTDATAQPVPGGAPKASRADGGEGAQENGRIRCPEPAQVTQHATEARTCLQGFGASERPEDRPNPKTADQPAVKPRNWRLATASIARSMPAWPRSSDSNVSTRSTKGRRRAIQASTAAESAASLSRTRMVSAL